MALDGRQAFIRDLLNRDTFAARVRYCLVKLQEFAIAEEEYFDYISEAIALHLEGVSYNNTSTVLSARQHLVAELANCFQLWYRPDDLSLMDFLREHQLIFVDFGAKRWVVSNLGTYFAQLRPFDAITFLCALEIVMTFERHQGSFISLKTLDHLLSIREDGASPDKKMLRSYSLRMFGLIEGFYSSSEDIAVTDFGYQVLSHVKEDLAELRDVILLMLETESKGFSYALDTDFGSLISAVEKSTIIIEDQKRSIRKAVDLYRSGSELDALRIIYPLLEGTLDSAIRMRNLSDSGLRGMRSKAERLVKEGMISPLLSTMVEVFNSRNKVVHGNIQEEDREFIKPLFILTTVYLNRLLMELS